MCDHHPLRVIAAPLIAIPFHAHPAQSRSTGGRLSGDWHAWGRRVVWFVGAVVFWGVV